jgi:hypothetical protein
VAIQTSSCDFERFVVIALLFSLPSMIADAVQARNIQVYKLSDGFTTELGYERISCCAEESYAVTGTLGYSGDLAWPEKCRQLG